MNKSKKVGILTFHYSRYNYGAVLQTFALSKAIKSFGHSPHIINFEGAKRTTQYHLWELIMSYLGVRFDEFRLHHLPNIMTPTYSQKELVALNDKLDTFVVGSDQVWRYIDNTETLLKYYLNFVSDDKYKFSYAASFGTDNWPTKNARVSEQVGALLKRFDSISVREESGREICGRVFNVDAIHVVDPTMLLEKTDYDKLAGAHPNVGEKYLVYMMLHTDSETESYFKGVAKRFGLTFVRAQGKKIYPPKMFYLFNSVEKWLRYIRDAEIVVTDSFHTLLFSIIFQRKFIILSNSITGNTRLKNVLETVGELPRMYDSIHEIDLENAFVSIDYSKVSRILKPHIQRSRAFLKENLDAE